MGQNSLSDILDACPLKDWVDNHTFTLRIGYDEDVRLVLRLKLRETRNKFKREFFDKYCEPVIGHLDEESITDLISCVHESYLNLTKYGLQVGMLVNKIHKEVEAGADIKRLVRGEDDSLVALLQKLDQGNFIIKWANYIQKLENYSKNIENT